MSLSMTFFALQGLKSVLGFASQRNADFQNLQQLHTDKLLNKSQALIDINERLDLTINLQANNEVFASGSGYDPFDSGSFKAINKQIEDTGAEDINRIEIGMKVKNDSINRSISNLNKSMRLSEIQLVADLGLAGAQYNMYLKDQRYIEMQRKLELKKAELAKNKVRFGGYSQRYGKFYRGRGNPYQPYTGPSMASKNLSVYKKYKQHYSGQF
jgi:hypothetical protein